MGSVQKGLAHRLGHIPKSFLKVLEPLLIQGANWLREVCQHDRNARVRPAKPKKIRPALISGVTSEVGSVLQVECVAVVLREHPRHHGVLRQVVDRAVCKGDTARTRGRVVSSGVSCKLHLPLG